jgi:large subunit ribosomal protein L28
MSKVCQVTGKRPVVGNNVSHANNKTKRRFEPNLHHHRFWLESENRFVRLRLTTKGMRIIDKLGIVQVISIPLLRTNVLCRKKWKSKNLIQKSVNTLSSKKLKLNNFSFLKKYDPFGSFFLPFFSSTC